MPSFEPYVGPRPFEENDRELFFGRDHETNDLVSLITAHPIVLLYAQSGAGKTSLVKASLIPKLINEEEFDVLPPMRVREQVGTSIAPDKIKNIYFFNALAGAIHQQSKQPVTQDELAALAQTSFSAFLKQRKGLGDKETLSTPTVAVFDQFEELFTLYPERWEERLRFFEQIRDALAEHPLLRVLFSMREDFIAELDPYASCLPERLRTRFRIERLNRRSALVAVTQPLKTVATNNGNRQFAEGAAEELIDNLLIMEVKTRDGIKKVKGKFVEALQLQVVCQSLWNSLKPGQQYITKKDLETFGDLNTALSAFYERAIEKTHLRTGIRSGALRRWCERNLITPAETRAPVFRDETETQGLKNEAVDELEKQSLLRMELRGGARWYELSHDRFVQVIKQSNQKWLYALPGTTQILLRLEERALKWDESDRQDKDLLNEAELFEAERWLATPEASELELGPQLNAFLRESRYAAEAKRQQESDRQKRVEEQAKTAERFRKLTYTLTILSLLAVASLAIALYQWRKANVLKAQAEEQRQRAEEQTKKVLEAQRKATELGSTVSTLTENLTRSEKIKEALNKLGNGDLEGASTAFQAILNERGDPVVRADAYRGLAQIDFKSVRYKDAVGHYDDALNTIGYSPAGKRLPIEIPAADEAKFKEKAAFLLKEKGDVYLAWGNQLQPENPFDTPGAAVLDKYKNARAFYRLAKAFGGPGVRQAADGITKAEQAIAAARPLKE